MSEVNSFGSLDANANYLKFKTEGRIALEVASDKAKAEGLEAETVMGEGYPAQELIAMSKDYNMIIMAIGGRSGVASGRIGTTARKLVEGSYCPVLTVKSGSNRIKDILLPVSNENMAAISDAIETAKRVEGNITVMSIKGKKNPDAEGLAKKEADRCAAEGVNVGTYIAEGEPLDSIVTQSGKYDLIIMGVDKPGGFKKILHGGLTERVVLMASCPVTVVRDV